ncbi:winged helix-turn-helix domain-containing protein [Granulicella mallensis]|uniref:Transcriptional regulator, CadC n=1 Tax=Granulicella mallensis (strain ATCC BAA-1857 / DSM 23137 / MP5ACTX8) TaxID=682795 RepID=G8NUP0_GRAMM|nr:winged helix-turn-helix domain-containing protein [Granulicella mallensis]AEU36491.1 transcriptional regulator, CadC [Granulicella mallensis MP5ACTX8]
MKPDQPVRAQFGAFELNLKTGELRVPEPGREDRKILLQEQPFQVLRLLIDHRGEIVTREEIRRTLWPNDTNVDFDHSINVAVASIRRALSDSASQPRYIETVARRGYRLVLPVELVESSSHERTAEGVEQESAQSLSRAIPPWKWIISATLLLVAISGGGFYWRGLHRPKLSAEDTIVVADISNQTSDPIFDDALNTALLVELQQTPFLNVLGADKVRGNLKLLNHPMDAKITPEIALQICNRTNSRAVVASSIADVGNHFRIELRGIDCKSGKTFARSSQDVGKRSEVVHALGVVGSHLRSRMGEPKTSILKFDKPLEKATSQSVEALQLLTKGYRQHFSYDLYSAITFYQRAIDIDPSFALAYAALAARYSNQDDVEAARAAVEKAYALRNNLTEQNRFQVESLYFDIGTWELEKAQQVHMEWAQTFPEDPRAHVNFASSLRYLGQYERSSTEARDAVRLLPSGSTYWALMTAAILSGQLDGAKGIFEEAQARGFDTDQLHLLRHLLGFLQHDESAMKEQLVWSHGKKDVEFEMLWRESGAQMYYGQFREAHRLFEHITSLTPGSGPSYEFREPTALQEIEVGNFAEGHRLIANAVRKDRSRNERLSLALIFARDGNLQEARQLAEAINHEFPLDTLTQNYCLPTIWAAIKLHENDPAGAIETLRPALHYDFAYPNAFNGVYPAYIRGIAYLQTGDGRSAAVEFQKVADHPAIVGRSVVGALAHLQLGRAQAMMGDKVGARKSYQDFLALWKDADSDIPIYKQAKAEYARLQ